MKTTLSVQLVEKRQGEQDYPRGTATMTTDLPFPPVAGMSIRQGGWKSSRPVVHVTLNLVDRTPDLHVFMGNDTAHSDMEYRALVETYKSHGWTVSGY
jgi:hypothetical protein